MRIVEADAVALPEEMTESARDDVAVLRRLYESHASYVRDLLVRLLGPGGDADDLTHEVFLIAWRRPQFLAAGIDARSWLVGIALKKVHAIRRRKRIRELLGIEEAFDVPDPHTPVGDLEEKDARRVVYAALEGLGEKKRTVFILFELQGMTGPEIAKSLGCNEQTVKTRLFHARREFAEAIGKWKADEARHG